MIISAMICKSYAGTSNNVLSYMCQLGLLSDMINITINNKRKDKCRSSVLFLVHFVVIVNCFILKWIDL